MNEKIISKKNKLEKDLEIKNQRVIILTNTLGASGAEKQSIYLAKVLKDEFNVSLIVYYGQHCDPVMVNLAKNIEDNILLLKGTHISKIIYLYKYFKKYPNSILISYLATTNFINAILGALAGVKIRIGGIRSSQLSKTKLIIQKYLHNYILKCSIFNNYSGLNNLINCGFNESKSVVIPNCIEFNQQPIVRKQTDNFKILTVGRFVKQKDYQTAFESIAKLIFKNNTKKKIKYIIVGHGMLEESLKKYYINLGIKGSVEFIINPPKVGNYYLHADVYLSTSLFEGLSNSIMEAMEYSLPIIATDVGDNVKLVKNGYNGYLTQVKEAKEISNKLLELLLNNEKRIEFGLNGFNHLHENYSCEKFKLKYTNLFEKLLAEAKK